MEPITFTSQIETGRTTIDGYTAIYFKVDYRSIMEPLLGDAAWNDAWIDERSEWALPLVDYLARLDLGPRSDGGRIRIPALARDLHLSLDRLIPTFYIYSVPNENGDGTIVTKVARILRGKDCIGRHSETTQVLMTYPTRIDTVADAVAYETKILKSYFAKADEYVEKNWGPKLRTAARALDNNAHLTQMIERLYAVV